MDTIKSKYVDEVLHSLNGIAYEDVIWTKKDLAFLKERYTKVLEHFDKVERVNMGLEIGLHECIVLFLIKKIFSTNKIFAVERIDTIKSYTSKFKSLLQNNNLILKSCYLAKDALPWEDKYFLTM